MNSARIGDVDLISTGKVIRTARVREEWDQWIDHPEKVVSELKESRFPADLFTFLQKFSDPKPRYAYPMEWDNLAVIRVESYDLWWTTQTSKNARNAVRKAEKRGVVVRETVLDEGTIRGIRAIYNETPIRQGKPFPHYGEDLDVIEAEHSTYPERSCFFGAYLEGELIGFIKLVRGDGFADIMNVLSKREHRDKSPTNALMAKAVEYCATGNIPYLTYGNYVYGRKGEDSLTNFKQHVGFRKIDIPRYYVPLSLRGEIAFRLKVHRSLADALPKKIYHSIREARNWYYALKYGESVAEK